MSPTIGLTLESIPTQYLNGGIGAASAASTVFAILLTSDAENEFYIATIITRQVHQRMHKFLNKCVVFFFSLRWSRTPELL